LPDLPVRRGSSEVSDHLLASATAQRSQGLPDDNAKSLHTSSNDRTSEEAHKPHYLAKRCMTSSLIDLIYLLLLPPII